ncbi:relaxase/mobilization nuclease domain-containing protein [Dysgonomonas massiliensis]|uniref:relaxase/mobilization nuclease domain-containing protein n=1 Tax=Dysgonomonas massiliensis TaxID=2040292 RepID=UPI001FE3926A|nr:relaxase/mobilization nuclease domain-containing protein [Dysgonomonas massiliensis]
MAYIYFLQKSGSFNHSFIVEALGLEYQSALHNEIYPEMLSLYRMILESKKYKNKGGKITLTNNFHQIDINSHAWFLDDMEKYFKDRFPDLTLEKINELLPKPNKAGRKAKDILTDEQYKAIADRYMEDMDYGNQPYVVFKHTDIDRAHLHVLSIRVDESGKNLDSNFENMR